MMVGSITAATTSDAGLVAIPGLNSIIAKVF